MDDALREKIRVLAEKNGLAPEVLEEMLGTGTVPEELEQAMTALMGDISRFAQALDGLDK
ncbi:hypothetical protein [uncultured Pseudodesulfovibrio sp.]|uniref:hypothetical protein n=1 Tax=uncultured Pseudodesulfovibrio sp. TaxID=2035858 RepID=UPI0029C78D38|nr:hypothetical protein [uncultured Pseudodesulfovibrio sp.]